MKILHYVEKYISPHERDKPLFCDLCGQEIKFGNQNFYITCKRSYDTWCETDDVIGCVEHQQNLIKEAA